MFKQCDSSSRQKNDDYFSQQVLRQNVRFLFERRKTLPHRCFILKPIERPCVPLRNCSRDF